MLMLVIETSTPMESVAVLRDGSVLSEVSGLVGRGHTEVLLGSVDAALGRAGVALTDLDAVAVSTGPGRFSGLRVGLATAKGLAAAAGLPVIPVPTLAALAESARPETGLVCPLLDARRGEVYAALFRMGAGRERLMDDSALSPEALVKRLAGVPGSERILFLGSGAVEYRDELRSALGERAALDDGRTAAPLPAAVAAIAEEIGPGGASPGSLEPVYLRGIQAPDAN